jgi:PTS system nitrogen regulatory IIA component
MEMHDLIAPEQVIAGLKAVNKKQALQELAKIASTTVAINDRAIFEILLERERLGSTGVGNGVAIPHGKLPGLKRLHCFFAKLGTAIDFEAVDDQPVDLVCLLLAPENAGADHLKALARISRLLRDKETCEKLRGSDSADALYALLTEVTTRSAA